MKAFARSVSTAVVDRLSAGRVQSVFRGAVNVQTADGLLSIVLPETGGVPNGIVLSEALDLSALVAPGQTLTVSNYALQFAGLQIDLRHAARWSPTLRLYGAFAPWPMVAPLVHPQLPRQAWTARVWPLVQAVKRGKPTAAEVACAGLLGLGQGLTPSGDDFLIGFSAALRATRHPLAQHVAQNAADAAPGRTTDLAAMFHRHAARGEYSQRIHTLLERLIAGPSSGDIKAALAWGATSGADCLLGALLGGYLDPALLD